MLKHLKQDLSVKPASYGNRYMFQHSSTCSMFRVLESSIDWS